MKSTKMMLMGIALMLVAIYIPHEIAFSTGGYELILLVIGFIVVFIGFCVNEKIEN